MRIASILVLALLVNLPSMTAHAGKIYKWRDADGNIHYGSAPPPEVEAKSTGQKTTTKKPEPPRDTDAKGNAKDDEQPISDKDRIRELEERLESLEGKRQDEKETGESKIGSPGELAEPGELSESDALPGEDGEEKISEEDKEPDYSIQGQVRMLERAERIEKMKTRCRAKAPHGIDCNDPGSYKQY